MSTPLDLVAFHETYLTLLRAVAGHFDDDDGGVAADIIVASIPADRLRLTVSMAVGLVAAETVHRAERLKLEPLRALDLLIRRAEAQLAAARRSAQ